MLSRGPGLRLLAAAWTRAASGLPSKLENLSPWPGTWDMPTKVSLEPQLCVDRHFNNRTTKTKYVKVWISNYSWKWKVWSLLKCFDRLGGVFQSGSRCSTSLRSSIRLVKKEVMGLIPDECWFFSLHIGLVVCPFNNGIWLNCSLKIVRGHVCVKNNLA